MNLQTDRELTHARRKPRLLQESYEEARHDLSDGEHVRELELESLKRLINQLKKEIARYEARHAAREY